MFLSYSLRITVLCTFVFCAVVCLYVSPISSDGSASHPFYTEGGGSLYDPGDIRGGPLYEPGVILIRYDKDTFDESVLDEFFSERGIDARVVETFDKLRMKTINVGGGADLAPIIRQLTTVPGVISAQPSIRVRPITER